MAGPGGGPPRKSHTKSRKGCKTCKRRHIRCDEHFPQCRNCTKHNCRCDYMDLPPSQDEEPQRPEGPDLLWTSSIEKEVDMWQHSGQFPFPELHLNSTRQFLVLSKDNLRLVHYLSSIYRDMQRKGILQCTAWVQELPSFLETAARYDFVMSALLTFSATHLAWITKSQETTNLAYYHRGVALNGLQSAIGNFSRENSDAILAASILLSWQASDWSGWTSLMQGISSVVSSMHPWKESSQFASYIEDHMPTRSPKIGHSPLTSLSLAMMAEDDRSLNEAIAALQDLAMYLTPNHNLFTRVEMVLNFSRDLQASSGSLRIEQLFEKLQPLREWLFYEPISLAQGKEISSFDILILSHLYAVALAVDRSIPELGGAAFGNLTIGPIEEIDRKIRYGQTTSRLKPNDSARLDDMMRFPRQISAQHRFSRSGSSNPGGGSGGLDNLMPGQHSPFGVGGFQNLNLDSQPSTPGFPGTYPLFSSHSSEDLSISPSPFPTDFQNHPSSVSSRRHSHLATGSSVGGGTSPRPSYIADSARSLSGLSFQGADSPASYSPSYSPGYFTEDDQSAAAAAAWDSVGNAYEGLSSTGGHGHSHSYSGHSHSGSGSIVGGGMTGGYGAVSGSFAAAGHGGFVAPHAVWT